MAALLTAFIAAALAELGDKTQLLVAALAARYASPRRVLAGVILAALVNAIIAATGGYWIHGLITPRAASLFVSLSLAFAGASAFFRKPMPEIGRSWRTGAFSTAAMAFFLVEFGDKTQFTTAALSAQFGSLGLTAAGATLGVGVASIPAAYLGRRFLTIVPLRKLQLVAGFLFLFAAFLLAIHALRLV